jgi:hypothetical protein
MDDYTNAFNLLNNFIHQLYEEYPYTKPIFLSKINQFTQAAIPAALENILDEIQESVNFVYRQTHIRCDKFESFAVNCLFILQKFINIKTPKKDYFKNARKNIIKIFSRTC